MTTTAPSLPFPVTPRRDGDAQPDLFAFELVHRALRSGPRTLAAALARGPYDRRRRKALVRFGRAYLHEIQSHHAREDDVLWPVIVASAGPVAELSDLTEDHHALEEVLDRAEAALAAFAGGDDSAAPALADVLLETADLLDEHIVEEEATVFPVVRRYVSAADYARCEKLFQKGAGPRHLAFVLPWIFSMLADNERDHALGMAPAPLRALLRVTTPGYRRMLERMGPDCPAG